MGDDLMDIISYNKAVEAMEKINELESNIHESLTIDRLDVDESPNSYPSGISHFYINSSSYNYPSTYGHVITMNYGTGNAMQLFTGSANSGIYYRETQNQSWQEWKELVTKDKIKLKSEDWNKINLQNEWSELRECKYLKDYMGFVHIKGIIKDGKSKEDTLLFTLPEGYRPYDKQYIPTYTDPDLKIIVLAIFGNGEVTIHAGNVDGYISLSAIPAFLAER